MLPVADDHQWGGATKDASSSLEIVSPHCGTGVSLLCWGGGDLSPVCPLLGQALTRTQQEATGPS